MAENQTLICDQIYIEYVRALIGDEGDISENRTFAPMQTLIEKSNHVISNQTIDQCLDFKSSLNVTYENCSENSETIGWSMMFGSEAITKSLNLMVKDTVIKSGGKIPLQAMFTCLDNLLEEFLVGSEVNETQTLIFDVLFVIIAIFGLIGNVALFATYWKKNGELPFNQLMMALSSLDCLFLLSVLISMIMIFIGGDREEVEFYGVFLVNGFCGSSFYITIAICMERYMRLCTYRYLIQIGQGSGRKLKSNKYVNLTLQKY